MNGTATVFAVSPAVTALFRYPVKSCRGEPVSTTTVERQGLAGDRRYMVVDDAGDVVTAREEPRLLLVHAVLDEGGLRLTRPDDDGITVAASRGVVAHGRLWGATVPVTRVGDEADAWLSSHLGRSVHLVHQHDPASRAPNPRRTAPTDRVSLADGYPVLVATEASLAAVNDWIAAGPRADEGPMSMTRFRPNIVVAGTDAWSEDGWRRLRIGEAVFRAVKGCDRCAITMTDPDTAERGHEPIATLARYRRFDGATWFGVNLVPDAPGARIRVGDEVEVLDAVDAPDGPLR